MANEIIDITRYLRREPATDLPRGAMSLWGADGENSRFALPLWRMIYLAQAERGLIVWADAEGDRLQTPFVALDLGEEPARTDIDDATIPRFSLDEAPNLVDLDGEGVIVYLGSRAGRLWTLVIVGGSDRTEPLEARTREDILFLAGECAGLLFLRDLADAIAPSQEDAEE